MTQIINYINQIPLHFDPEFKQFTYISTWLTVRILFQNTLVVFASSTFLGQINYSKLARYAY